MQASIKTNADGSIALELDVEAARAVFASVLFAARFHERFAPLAKIAKESFELAGQKTARRQEPCR